MTDHKSSLGHLPAGKWEFDMEVTRVFDDMIARSIPQYDALRALVAALARRYGAEGGTVLDLGCSTGLSIDALARDAAQVVGVEISESMLDVITRKFESFCNVEIVEMDLRHGFPELVEVDVVLSIFTLQFIPVEYRARVVRDVYAAMKPGGALIVAEKVLGETAQTQAAFVEVYHAFKQAQGYSREEVDRKALSLEGRLVSLTPAGNEGLLRAAGFSRIECFWRWANFGAWLAVK